MSVKFLMNETEKDSSYLHILKYTALFGSVQGLSILAGIARNKLVAIILGPSGMGLLSLFKTYFRFNEFRHIHERRQEYFTGL